MSSKTDDSNDDAKPSSLAGAAGETAGFDADVRILLLAIYGIEQRGGAGLVSRDALNDELGRERGNPATDRELARLSRAGYLTRERTTGHRVAFNLSEKGLQQVAGWPGAPDDNLADQFLAAPNGIASPPKAANARAPAL